MTNGEKVVQLFPNAQVDQGETRVYVWLDHSSTTFDRKWWEAEYIEPSKSKIPTGSTTKNNLGVDCISRDEVCRYVAEFVNCEFSTREEEELIDNIITGIECMPSVTPQEPRWIPVKFRPLTDEEQDEYPDYCYMADCPMPDDGEEILVCTKHGGVEKDECVFDDGFYLDSGYDWQTDIVAWMPLPEPYKAESEDKE